MLWVLISSVIGLALIGTWWAYFRGYRMVFLPGFENAGSAPEIESWLMDELGSTVAGRDESGRYWTFSTGTLTALGWRRRSAQRFGLQEAEIELRYSW